MDDPFAVLKQRIADRSARLAVVGLGYVGTPVACRFAEVGFSVLGVDIDADRVAAINAGRAPFAGHEPGLVDLLARVVAGGTLRATADFDALTGVNVLIVAVETPVDAIDHRPRYAALRDAVHALGSRLWPGSLVIIESTIAPGTMGAVVAPALAAASGLAVGVDVLLAHCPERVMPGRLLANLSSMSRVVGGTTLEAAAVAAGLYRHVVEADLDTADALTAEIVKAGENAYRDVQIAFANEMALLCESVGADVWRVRELINKSPGRHMLLPGAGVGGHCIPKDPWLLISGAGDDFDARLIPAARAVNDAMPLHLGDAVVNALSGAGIAAADARVAVLGWSYLEDSDDDRNSPSATLVDRLRAAGVTVVVHDPWVPELAEMALDAVVTGADAVVVMVAHTAYRTIDWVALRPLVRTPLIFDGRHLVDAEAAKAGGWSLRTVGVGAPCTPTG